MKKAEEIIYRDPVDWPIPEGTDPVDALTVVLSKAEGILSLVVNDKGRVVDSGLLTGQAIWAAEGLINQAQLLVDYWHNLDIEK